MKISSRTRFLVLKRDGFKCVYCGRHAGQVELHVDHVEAKSKGGADDLANFVTACQSCNTGKGASDVFVDAGTNQQSSIAATPSILGKCFVIFGHREGEVHICGIVRAKITEETFLVQYFNAFDDEPSTLQIVKLSAMAAAKPGSRENGCWEFFEDVEHLGHWFKNVYRGPKDE